MDLRNYRFRASAVAFNTHQGLETGGYENLSDPEKNMKLAADFRAFIRRRAELVFKAVKLLAEGRQLNASEICREQT